MTARSVSFLPSGAWMTTEPEGTLMASSSVSKCSFISSWVTVESMSGMEKVGLGSFAYVAAPKPSAPRMTIQATRNGHALR